MHAPSDIWEKPTPMLILLDNSLKDIGLYIFSDFLMWQILWPDSEIQSKWVYTILGALMLRILRLVAMTVCPMSGSEYYSGARDHIHEIIMLLWKKDGDTTIIPLNFLREINSKLTGLSDESGVLMDWVYEHNFGHTRNWWALRRHYHAAHKLYQTTQYLSLEYSRKMILDERAQEKAWA